MISSWRSSRRTGPSFATTTAATCSLCALVKVGNTPSRGWYTAQVSNHAGDVAFGNFTLRYGAYSQGNPNCATPTNPQIARELASPDKEAGVEEFGVFVDETDPTAESDAPGQ